MAYKALVNPDVAVTGGTFRNLTVVIPEGSVFNARPPCATIYYASPVLLLIDLIMKAVSSAVPDRVVAGQPSSPATVGFSGSRADGSQYVTSEASALGWGGFAGGDGANAIVNYGAGDLKNHPIEVLESQYPLRVVQFALREDSGGKGEWRGGLGTVREYEVLEEGTSVSLWLERSANPGWGLLGGEEGVATKGEVQVGTKVSVELKVADLPLPRFARVRVMTGGGGGFGDPKKRSAEAIQRDLEDGYVRAPPQGE
jgi:N-methylhydantoinase B